MLKIVATVLLAACTSVCAAFPDKPIKVYVGYAPGGSTDVVARLLAPKLGEKLGQAIIIENKPGGTNAHQQLARPGLRHRGLAQLQLRVLVAHFHPPGLHLISPGIRACVFP